MKVQTSSDQMASLLMLSKTSTKLFRISLPLSSELLFVLRLKRKKKLLLENSHYAKASSIQYLFTK